MAERGRKNDAEEAFEPTRELGAPVQSQARRAAPAEEGGAATALMDVSSMEGLQAQSRPGGSIPPPPNSDAQPTSILEPNRLDELVNKATDERLPRAPSTALVQSARSRFTPTLRSADLEPLEVPSPSRWALLVGIALFGAGLGAFVALRPGEPAPAAAASIQLVVKASPGAARFQLDGEALPGNPHQSERPAGGKRQTLTIEADGHTPQSLELVLDSSTVVDVALTPASAAP